MAYTLSDALQTIAKEANEALRQFTPSWGSWVNLHTDKQAALRRWADHGVAKLQTWDGSSTITEVPGANTSSREHLVTPDGYASRVTVPDFDARMVPGLVEKRTADLLGAFEKRIESICYTILEGGFTSSHDVGGSTDPIISAVSSYIDADFTGTYETAQSNLITAALSESSVSTARQMLLESKLPNGEPSGQGTGPMVLIVAPQNANIANRIVGSPTITHTDDASTGMGSLNTNFGTGIEVIVSPYLTSDPDDWFLVEKYSCVNLWMPDQVRFIYNNTNAGGHELMVIAHATSWIDTPPLGIIGSNVAG